MTIFKLILLAFLVVWFIHYIAWGTRLVRVLNRHRELIEKLHPGAFGEDGFPPTDISFP